MNRVLICDDSNMILNLMEIRLKKLGYQIIGKASNGQKALEAYIELKPDLVFLDITMPIKDGKTCLSEIRETDSNANVIIVSAIDNESTFTECINLGAIGFISKATISNPSLFQSQLQSIIENKTKVC